MHSKLLRLSGFLALVILMAFSVACSNSNNGEATGPTAPAPLSFDTDMTSVEALGLAGQSVAKRHGGSDSDSASDDDSDQDSDLDSDQDGDDDSDQDSDLDSDQDSDGDGCDNSGPGSLSSGPGGCDDDSEDDSGDDSTDDSGDSSGDDSGRSGGGFGGLSDEFKGRVDAVDPGSRSLVLRNGSVVVLRGADWDPLGDLVSFRQVSKAFDSGAIIRVEGFGSVEADGTIRAQTVKAETNGDGDGGGGGDDQFNASVIGVDVGSGLVFLANGITVVVNQATVWDPLGDLFTLESTAGAVSMGRPVRAEGDAALQPDGTVLALTIKVEVDD